MLNFAPIRYARVMRLHGGPIERLETSLLNRKNGQLYQATAYLSEHLNLRKPSVEVFGKADGTGTDPSAMQARFKAISEALERWAFFFLLQCGETERYGFDIDSSSTGLAAYPGLFRRGARLRARAEAVERYCLTSWWEGQLNACKLDETEKGIHCLEIDNPHSPERVVIVWSKDRHGLYAYGFAGHRKLAEAQRQAIIEMERSAAAMGSFLTRNPTFGPTDLEQIKNWQERRILYFAMPEGHEQFIRQLEASSRLTTAPKRARPIIDTELMGPWSRYATVWRVLYQMPKSTYLDPRETAFFW